MHPLVNLNISRTPLPFPPPWKNLLDPRMERIYQTRWQLLMEHHITYRDLKLNHSLFILVYIDIITIHTIVITDNSNTSRFCGFPGHQNDAQKLNFIPAIGQHQEMPF